MKKLSAFVIFAVFALISLPVQSFADPGHSKMEEGSGGDMQKNDRHYDEGSGSDSMHKSSSSDHGEYEKKHGSKGDHGYSDADHHGKKEGSGGEHEKPMKSDHHKEEGSGGSMH